MTKQPVCDGCPLLASCPYAAIFETRPPEGGASLQDFSQVPRPYVIEPPAMGERDYAPGAVLAFHLVFAGRAEAIEAWLPKPIERMDAKEVRKQLKLAALRA